MPAWLADLLPRTLFGNLRTEIGYTRDMFVPHQELFGEDEAIAFVIRVETRAVAQELVRTHRNHGLSKHLGKSQIGRTDITASFRPVPDPPQISSDTMQEYHARMFNKGATITNVFWLGHRRPR